MQEILHSEAEVAAQQQAGTVPNVAAKPVRPKIDLQLQQLVRLKTDPYTDLTGIVSEIDDERGKIKVLVNMFGRETPVEVDYTQIEKVE
jgi:transcriptional antiterminator NusG